MANVRIKDITTTASAPNDDDYLAIDGETNGTRKLFVSNVTNSVPSAVKEAVYTLFDKAVYTETGLDDELEIIYEWAYPTVTAISINPNTLIFDSLSSQTLVAVLSPAGVSATVHWTSSDDSVATVNDSGVVTSVGNGTCIITATAGAVSAICNVSVSGIAEVYSVTNTLVNCTNSNPQTAVEEGSSYTATITANTGYMIDEITCTMGGVSQTVTDGVISIAEVTGDISISASASVGEVVYTNSNITLSGNNYINTNVALFSAANNSRDFTITMTNVYMDNSKGSASTAQRALLACMDEHSPWPGFVVRQDIGSGVIKIPNATLIDSLIIKRESGTISVQSTDSGVSYRSGSTNQHDVPVTIGCGLDANLQPFRYCGGTIGSIVIKFTS